VHTSSGVVSVIELLLSIRHDDPYMLRIPTVTCVLALLVTISASASSTSRAETSTSAAAPIGRVLLQTRGIWTSFEHRGATSGYYSGELLEAIGGVNARNDVLAQLRVMRAMGVNEFAYEMRSSDGPWPVDSSFPKCERATVLGPSWPQPSDSQLTGLKALYGLAHQYGMRITLVLDTTHMDQPESNTRWLGSIISAVKDLPAFDLVVIGGDRHVVDAQPPYDGVPDSCGGESEVPLWLGPDSIEGRYVQWAIALGRSLGVPPEKLTAEAIVGDYRMEAQQGAGPNAQDGHLWRPLEVMRTIYDRLGFPPGQRTYALSVYAHRKCAYVESWAACSDEEQNTWLRETLATSRARVEPQARLTLAEFGSNEGQYQRTLEQLGAAIRDLGLEGGNYWQWADVTNDPKWTPPGSVVKQRGYAFSFNPQQRELADLYGFHLTDVPNGSFEQSTSGWTVSGQGQALSLDESAPRRGKTFLRLVGKATSGRIRVSPSTRYTTTARLRFASSPNVTFRFSTCKNKPVVKRKRDRFRPAGPQPSFQTFPLVYTTPADACWLRMEFSAPTTLDVDDVR